MPLTAVHLMSHDVLPAFESARAHIDILLSESGREFYGRPNRHPYKLFLLFERTLSNAPRKSIDRSPKASWNSSSARCSTNAFGSKAGGSDSRLSTRCG